MHSTMIRQVACRLGLAGAVLLAVVGPGCYQVPVTGRVRDVRFNEDFGALVRVERRR